MSGRHAANSSVTTPGQRSIRGVWLVDRRGVLCFDSLKTTWWLSGLDIFTRGFLCVFCCGSDLPLNGPFQERSRQVVQAFTSNVRGLWGDPLPKKPKMDPDDFFWIFKLSFSCRFGGFCLGCQNLTNVFFWVGRFNKNDAILEFLIVSRHTSHSPIRANLWEWRMFDPHLDVTAGWPNSRNSVRHWNEQASSLGDETRWPAAVYHFAT